MASPGRIRSELRTIIDENRGLLVFTSGFIVFTFVFVIGMASWGTFDKAPRSPTFGLRDFTVSNFSVSDRDPGLAATWEANLTVVNPNSRFTIDFTRIRSFVYYSPNHGNRLSLSSEGPLHLEKDSTASMTVRTYTTRLDEQKASVVKDIREELEGTGMVTFNLGIHLKESWNGHRRFPHWLYHNQYHVMTMYCQDMKVAFRFSGDIGFGAVSLPSNNRSSEVPCRISYCSWLQKRAKTLDC